jgi:hypothetical protein
MEGTGAHAVVQMRARLTDLVLIVFQVGNNRAAFDLPDGLDQRGQVQFNAALFAGRQARRAPGRPLDTSAANLLADFIQILGEFGFSDHDPPPLYVGAEKTRFWFPSCANTVPNELDDTKSRNTAL